MTTIAILGAGASAAYIHAVCRKFSDVKVEVFTDKIPAPPIGAMWFRNIPNDMKMKARTHHISIIHLGDKINYLRRQWGDEDLSKIPTSFGQTTESLGYKPSDVLPLLWGDANINILSDRLTDADVYRYAGMYDFVFSTFPLESVRNKIPRIHIVRIPIVATTGEPNNRNFVIYNGTQVGYIVRISQIYGKLFIEYPQGHILDYNAIGEGADIGTFLDMHPRLEPPPLPSDLPENVAFLGRLAEFKRHRLAHDVYTLAGNILRELCSE